MSAQTLHDAEHHLRNLLAIIHRDGGHHAAAHGLIRSTELAIGHVYADRTRADAAKEQTRRDHRSLQAALDGEARTLPASCAAVAGAIVRIRRCDATEERAKALDAALGALTWERNEARALNHRSILSLADRVRLEAQAQVDRGRISALEAERDEARQFLATAAKDAAELRTALDDTRAAFAAAGEREAELQQALESTRAREAAGGPCWCREPIYSPGRGGHHERHCTHLLTVLSRGPALSAPSPSPRSSSLEPT